MTDQVDSTTPPTSTLTLMADDGPSVEYSTTDVAETLLIKDCHPWETRANERVLNNLGESYDTIRSDAVSNASLSSYDTIIIPSTQTAAYYRSLNGNSDTFHSFVSNGGTLVAHVTDDGWPCTTQSTMDFLPGNVGKRNDNEDELDRVDSDYPVFDGISDEDLDGWSSSTHGYLTGLPSDATIAVAVNGDTNRPTYAEYDHGDGRVLATMQTFEWPWARGNGTKEALRNELEYAVSGGFPDSVSASVSTVQFIPGENENVTEGGHPLNSALMHVFDDQSLEVSPVTSPVDAGYVVPYGPVLDSWYYGDMKDEIPADLDEAIAPNEGKYRDAFGDRAFKSYRHINGMSVSFTNSNGSIDEDSIEIEFNESGVEPDDETVSLRGDENPYSVLVDHEVNGIPHEEWFGEEMRQANQEPRFYSYETDFEYDGVPGVRVLTISGGYVGFGEEIARRSANDPVEFLSQIWDWDVPEPIQELAAMADPVIDPLMDMLAVIPRTWSFVEFIVLADGRRYARVWDASQYPSLFTYMDGERQAMDKMPYEPQETLNPSLLAFFTRATADLTPYQGALGNYMQAAGNPEQLQSDFESECQNSVSSMPVSYQPSNFVPILPRETVGLESEEGEEIDDPSGPFGSQAPLFTGDIIEQT